MMPFPWLVNSFAIRDKKLHHYCACIFCPEPGLPDYYIFEIIFFCNACGY